jgi:hypothetical protein
MHGICRRLSYANVLASFSLFLALGGGAYAAGTQSGAKTGPRITTVSVPGNTAAGTLVARAGGVRLETAGVGYALRVRNDTSAGARYACHGIAESSQPDGPAETGGPNIVALGNLIAGETRTIVANSPDPNLLTCRLADGETGAVTEAIIGPRMNALYTGHVISDYAQ